MARTIYQEVIARLNTRTLLPPPLEIDGYFETLAKERETLPDLQIRIQWQEQKANFLALVLESATPLQIERAIKALENTTQSVDPSNLMVIAPYLSEEHFDRLLDRNISGIDLSGNCLIVLPGQWLIKRTGKPNRFPDSRPIQNVYAGRSAFVGRTLLSQPRFSQVQAIKREIEERGGQISLGTVSKVLKALEEDLIINRNGTVSLRQPDRLLQRLVENFEPPGKEREIQGYASDLNALRERLTAIRQSTDVKIVECFPDAYTSSATAGIKTTFYVSVLQPTGAEPLIEVDHLFPNVRLIESDDELVFFDPEKTVGLPRCSKLQSYLMLMMGGKRERELAAQLRPQVLPDQLVGSSGPL